MTGQPPVPDLLGALEESIRAARQPPPRPVAVTIVLLAAGHGDGEQFMMRYVDGGAAFRRRPTVYDIGADAADRARHRTQVHVHSIDNPVSLRGFLYDRLMLTELAATKLDRLALRRVWVGRRRPHERTTRT